MLAGAPWEGVEVVTTDEAEGSWGDGSRWSCVVVVVAAGAEATCHMITSDMSDDWKNRHVQTS